MAYLISVTTAPHERKEERVEVLTSAAHRMRCRIERARVLADLIEDHHAPFADLLATTPEAITSVASHTRQLIEEAAGLEPKIRDDSGSYASWATWLLVGHLLRERRPDIRETLRDRQAEILQAAINRKAVAS